MDELANISSEADRGHRPKQGRRKTACASFLLRLAKSSLTLNKDQ